MNVTQVIGGTGVVANIGAGLVTLNATNTYQGGTVISAGTLAAAKDAAFGSGPLTVGANGTANFTSLTPTVGALSGAGNVVLTDGTGSHATNLTVNSAVNSAFSGVITDAGTNLGSLTKTGPATLTLSNAANTFGNGLTVKAGVLSATNQAQSAPVR